MEQSHLEEIYEAVKDIQKRVKRLERKARWATIGSVIKWLVYIAIAVASYYYIQPYIEQVQKMYAQIQETSANINEIKVGTSDTVSELLNKFNLGGE